MNPSASSPSRWLLLDGHNLAYRAFFAIPTLNTRDGRPTNALLGFIRILDKLRALWKPDRLAAAFDAGLPEHRLQALPEYKANRPPMPDTLRPQLDWIAEYLTLAGIPVRRQPGEEADDVLASWALRAARAGGEALIATSDKDLMQLVGDRIRIVSPAHPDDLLDREAVFRKTGVPPERIVDWLALTGDTADNIPGVPGVGPKTAAQLLEQFGSLDALGAQLSNIRSERIRRLVHDHWSAVLRNREVVRLNADLAAPCDAPAPAPAGALQDFFQRMELRSLSKPAQPSLADW